MMRPVGRVQPSSLQHAMPPATRANATMAGRIAPNKKWLKGQIMGQETVDSDYGPYHNAPVLASAVATATGGTIPIGTYLVGATFVFADGSESALSNTISATLAAIGKITTTTNALPTGVTGIRVYYGATLDDLALAATANANTVVVTTPPVDADDAPPEAGTDVATSIAAYSGATDAQGRVYLGEPNDEGEVVLGSFYNSPNDETLEMYYGGLFYLTDLIGLDAQAIADLGGRIIMGGKMLLIPT